MIDDEPNTQLAFTDLLFNMLSVIFVLFVLAIVNVNVKKPPQDGVKLVAEYVVTIQWDQKHDSDIDLWAEDPHGDVVWFHQMESSTIHLDHDSRGSMSDGNTSLVTGNPSDPEGYQEVLTVRRAVAGTYVINLHMYGAVVKGIIDTSGHGHGDPYEVPVRVKVVKLNPKFETKFDEVVTLHEIWEERTALRFTLDDKGNWVGFDREQQPLVQ